MPLWSPFLESHLTTYTLTFAILPSFNVAPSLMSQNPWEQMFSTQTSLLVVTFPPIYHGFFYIKVNYRRIQTTHLHTSRCHHCEYCHYCNVDFVLFHNVTCYNNFLLSRIHVNTTSLFNFTCTFGCHQHDIREVRVYHSNIGFLIRKFTK
jgi:hypothetical protein